MNLLLFVAITLSLHVSAVSAWDWPKIPSIPMLAGPKAVDSLVISGLTGRWFQMYTSLIPSTTFEKDGVCIVADVFESAPPTASTVSLTFDFTQKYANFNETQIFIQ